MQLRLKLYFTFVKLIEPCFLLRPSAFVSSLYPGDRVSLLSSSSALELDNYDLSRAE